MRTDPDYSIVIPVYFNEGELIDTMAALISEVFDKNPELNHEVIFVDDGSEDGSFEELRNIQRQHPQVVRIIKLTRNFGQVPALLAGFEKASGKCIVAMSADGQDPAGLINDMLKAHFDEGYEIVACERTGRDESFYRIITSRIFYALMRKLSFVNMPEGGFDYILLGQRAVKTVLGNREPHMFLQGQILWTGFSTKFIKYRRRERKTGKSKWTFGKKLTYLIDGVMGFSFLPIRMITVFGLLIAMLAFAYASLIFILRVFGGIPVKGWAPLMIVILALGGIQLTMLGIIGEYLWRTLAKVRGRDLYVIDSVYEEDDS